MGSTVMESKSFKWLLSQGYASGKCDDCGKPTLTDKGVAMVDEQESLNAAEGIVVSCYDDFCQC